MQFRAFETVPFSAGTVILALCFVALGRVAFAQDFPITPGDIISDGVPAPGAGYIHVSTNTDVYTFSGTAGQVIFLEEISVAAAFQGWLNWDLKTPGGATLMSAYFDGKHEGRRVLPETGTYTLRVRLLSNNPAYVGPYSFRVRPVPPDDIFAIAIGQTISNNIPHPGAGNLEVTGANDVYEFAANAGDHAFFEEISVAAAFKGWLQWELKAPSGLSVFRSFLGGSHEGRRTLPETGKYSLRVSAGANDISYTGQYAFAIHPIPPDPTFAITLGQIVTNQFPGPGAGHIEVAGAQDFYTFSGVAGQSLFFENMTAAASLGGWLRWEVKAPSGQVLFTSFFGTTPAGRKTLNETGTYTIRCWVGATDPAYVGTYSFRILPIDDSNFALSLGQLVADGVPGAGAGRIDTAGGQDLYSFAAEAGQKIVLEEISAAPTFGGWLRWELRTPASNVLAIAFFEPGRRQRIVLPQSGIYSMRFYVVNSNPQYVGTYSFRAFCEVFAGPDHFAASPGRTLMIPKGKFLCNDLAEPTDVLTVDLPSSSSTAGGALSDTNEFIAYTPAAGTVGIDTFVYRLRGMFGGESLGHVDVLVGEGADYHATVVTLSRVNASTVQVCLLGAPGQNYQVENSPDLHSWTYHGDLLADETGSMSFAYSTVGPEKMFYRFRRP